MSEIENQSVSAQVENPVFHLAKIGDIEGLRKIFTGKIYFEMRDAKGNSPLMLASYYGQIDAVIYLLSLGANANFIDRSGNSILMGVAFKGYPQIAELLIKAGANTNYKNPKGMTALDFAFMFGKTEVAKLLKQHTTENTSRLKSWIKFLLPKKTMS